MRREMMARREKKQVAASKQLEELTSAELAEVSGGGASFHRRHHRHHHHRHHRHFPFI